MKWFKAVSQAVSIPEPSEPEHHPDCLVWDRWRCTCEAIASREALPAPVRHPRVQRVGMILPCPVEYRASDSKNQRCEMFYDCYDCGGKVCQHVMYCDYPRCSGTNHKGGFVPLCIDCRPLEGQIGYRVFKEVISLTQGLGLA